jgi:hypothetical protein
VDRRSPASIALRIKPGERPTISAVSFIPRAIGRSGLRPPCLANWLEDRGKQFLEWVNTLPEQLKCYVLGGPIWQDIPDKALNWLAVREAIHRYVTINYVREDLETVVWINQVMALPELPLFSYPLIARAGVYSFGW